ncbi:type I-E CRISPR-associated protein Cse2/CasB [Salinibacter grassmerensis]|uniref:type I-E CRISPR-associated protein Cse2/CasB n=1 Tax=Salinibacter grassmerensis TaxID=3040353 RepID=UPI0021E793A9|nr:type I-E CRISPR-associated protein Cse2/CasB [Salinibacter grassmerensis]
MTARQSSTWESTLDSLYQKLGNGEQASLRRGEMKEPFWRMLAAIGREEPSLSREDKTRWYEKWQLIIQLIAQAGYKDVPLGRALAKADVNEYRVDRLLSAEGKEIDQQLRGIGSLLESASQKADWRDARYLLLSEEEGYDDERARIDIARTYYTYE